MYYVNYQLYVSIYKQLIKNKRKPIMNSTFEMCTPGNV